MKLLTEWKLDGAERSGAARSCASKNDLLPPPAAIGAALQNVLC
jgi:hypothetical protein